MKWQHLVRRNAVSFYLIVFALSWYCSFFEDCKYLLKPRGNCVIGWVCDLSINSWILQSSTSCVGLSFKCFSRQRLANDVLRCTSITLPLLVHVTREIWAAVKDWRLFVRYCLHFREVRPRGGDVCEGRHYHSDTWRGEQRRVTSYQHS